MAEKLKIIPLGGLNEIGKNLTVYEYGNDIIIVDVGMGFPDDDMYGVDVVIPDVSYLIKHKDKILERNRKIVFGNRDIAQAWIDTQHRVSWTAPQGVSTSFIKLDIPEDDEEFCKRLLAERGVLLVPGSRFELPCGARLGYCASEDVLREGLRLLGEALAEFDR